MVRHKMEQAAKEQEDQARDKELEQEGSMCKFRNMISLGKQHASSMTACSVMINIVPLSIVSAGVQSVPVPKSHDPNATSD